MDVVRGLPVQLETGWFEVGISDTDITPQSLGTILSFPQVLNSLLWRFEVQAHEADAANDINRAISQH